MIDKLSIPKGWKIYKTESDGDEYIAIAEDGEIGVNRRVVCIVSDMKSLDDQDKRNSTLIVAAPNLRNALIDAIMTIENDEIKRLGMQKDLEYWRGEVEAATGMTWEEVKEAIR